MAQTIVDDVMEDILQDYEDPDRDYSVTIDGFEIVNEEDEFDAIELFRYAVSQNASDIHLVPGAPPKIRVNGNLIPVSQIRTLTSADTDDLRQQTMSDKDLGQFIDRKYDHGYAYDLPNIGRFRMMVALATMGAITLTARKLVDTPPTFDDLNTLTPIRDLANFSSGLILVSGITGSGKSTLMAAMINEINKTRPANIISIEDPIEILHRSDVANVIQRNIGTDVMSFSDGVRDAMRQDPDIILIGEIRDEETAQAALKAAETGHLVISTIHGKTTITSISRMLDLFSGDELKSARNRFADVLRGIVSQKLVESTDPSGIRVPVNEILLNTHELKLALEADASPTELRQLLENGSTYGMQTFESHFKTLVEQNIVAEKVALSQASLPDQMQELLNSISEEDKFDQPEITVSEDKGLPKFPFRANFKPTISFSELVRQEEKDSGVVITPSGAAPILPKAPVRPAIYLPPK